MGRKSVYDEHYRTIRKLLISGMGIAEVHKYLQKHFGLYMSYQSFYKYIRVRELDSLVQSKVVNGNSKPKTIPEQCKFPNCFQCVYRDCMREGGASISGEELYELYNSYRNN